MDSNFDPIDFLDDLFCQDILGQAIPIDFSVSKHHQARKEQGSQIEIMKLECQAEQSDSGRCP